MSVYESHELEEKSEDSDAYSQILDDIAGHAWVETSSGEVEEPTPRQFEEEMTSGEHNQFEFVMSEYDFVILHIVETLLCTASLTFYFNVSRHL